MSQAWCALVVLMLVHVAIGAPTTIEASTDATTRATTAAKAQATSEPSTQSDAQATTQAATQSSTQASTAPTTEASTQATTTQASTQATTTQASTQSSNDEGWTIVFRADNPALWGQAAGDVSDANGFVAPTSGLPGDMRFLRLLRMDTGEAVIVPLHREQVDVAVTLDGDVMWRTAETLRAGDGQSCTMLGVARRSWHTSTAGQQIVVVTPDPPRSGFRGWGFSKPTGRDFSQTYSWNGAAIKKTVFEIAVRSSDLRDEEKGKLLVEEKNVQAVASGPKEDSAGGATSKPAKDAHALRAVMAAVDPSGNAVASVVKMSVTAAPGPPMIDPQIRLAGLPSDDLKALPGAVSRAIQVKTPRWNFKHMDVQFDGHVFKTKDDGLGAAMGTLIRSQLDHFTTDANVAMAGEVAADGTIGSTRLIAARLHAAAQGGATIFAAPMANGDALSEAMVFEGIACLSRLQVIGISDLDSASAVAREDRASDLKQAMEQYAQAEALLEKNPDSVRYRGVRDKLGPIVALAPNHLSAKFLLAMSQEKTPRRLSKEATEYYLAAAIRSALPAIDSKRKLTDTPAITPDAVKEALKGFDRLHRVGDPTLVPLADAWRDFVRVFAVTATGNSTAQLLQTKAQGVELIGTRVSVTREVLEKALREGL